MTTTKHGNPVVSNDGSVITLPARNKHTQYIFVFDLVAVSAAGAGYSWPALTGPSAPGIRIWKGDTDPGTWGSLPGEFNDVTVNGSQMILRDSNDDGKDYSYCLQVTNSEGRSLTFDPRINNSPN